MSKIVISTLSCDQIYPVVVRRYEDGATIRNDIRKSVVIRGMANVIDARGFQTLSSRNTEVTDEEADLLMECAAFKAHMDAGFVKILGMGETEAKAVDEMTEKDNSSQLTADDMDEVAAAAERADADVKVGKKSIKRKRR